MRLLYVIDSLAPGGAETSLADMAPELVRLGVDLHVLPLGRRLDLAPRLEEGGAVLHHGGVRPTRWANVKIVMQTARTVRAGLVHTTLYEADIAGRSGARLAGIPSTTSLVSDSYGSSHYAEVRPLTLHAARAVDALTARFATRFHAITRAIATSVPPRIGIPLDRVDVIPRGRDPERFRLCTPDQRSKVRAALQLPSDVPVILAVGRLEPSKGLQHLLAALPPLASEQPGLVTLIAGKDGRSAAALRDQALRTRLDVRFLGHRDDVPDLMAAADVFCFPSEREGFGGVLIEALASGCPIVASDIPTTREVLGTPDGPVGRLAAVGDAPALARAISAALGSESTARALASRGRMLFEHRYTTQAVAQQMLAFFEGASDTVVSGKAGQH